MNARIFVCTFLLMAVTAAPAFSAERTVTLAVENMTCASCPYIVKNALGKVLGVETVSVSFEEEKATVTFEDTKASINDLTAATTDVGFPSSLVNPEPQNPQE